MKKIGLYGAVAIFALYANSAFATWVEGAVYCDANENGTIDVGIDTPLTGVTVNTQCLGATDPLANPLPECPNPNDPFTKVTDVNGTYLMGLVHQGKLSYDMVIGGVGLPGDAVVTSFPSPAMFGFPLSLDSEFINPDYVHTFVAKVDWLVKSAVCLPEPDPYCGDGNVDEGEMCDDGNNVDGDGCNAACDIEICGDMIINNNGTEQCDDGNQVNEDDECRNDCTLPFCGDGFLDMNEQCDDGNIVDGDGCSANCTIEETGGGQGCTPGYWKQKHHFFAWMSPYTPETAFNDVFDSDLFEGMTLLNILKQGGGGIKALGRHAVASLLNSANGDVSYDMSTAMIISNFNAAAADSGSAIESLKDLLNDYNEQGCPLGNGK